MRAQLIGYRLLSRFAEVLPAALIGPLSRVGASIGARVFGAKSQTLRINLTRVLRREPDAALVRAALASYLRYWLESFRLPVVPRDQLNQRVRMSGFDHIQAARAHGTGIILALPHVGNWDVAGAWLVAQGVPLTVVVERLDPPELFTWFRDFRASLGVNVVTNDEHVGRELLAALGRNEAIALLCDRDVDGTGAPVDFFNVPTRLPRGPATLALRSGAPLLPVAAYEEARGHHIHALDPVPTDRRGTLRADVERVTNDLTRGLETLITRHPEQWHAFSPYPAVGGD